MISLVKKIDNFLNLKELGKKVVVAIVLTLTVITTVWVYAAFIEPTVGPNSSDQDFIQNILGANNNNNDFDSSLVSINNDGSVLERLEYLSRGLYATECGESTTTTQTSCYVDDTVRYLTTDLCNEAKENQCFVPIDNSYYAFGAECADSTTTTTTNCYVDDTAKYVDSNACSAASNSGYCFINTATFSAMDADLVVGNIKAGVTIFGVTGVLASAKGNPDYPDLVHIASFIEPSASPADYDQDFSQNILGANNTDNDFDSSLVTASSTGSIIERLEYLASRLNGNDAWVPSECGESTTAVQTNCHVDDTARYLTTDLCNEAKENQCFVPTDNNYYAFNVECPDATLLSSSNCYVDDTAKYVASNTCSAASNTGYCYMNAANFSDMDADLVASNIVNGVTIFGVAGSYVQADGSPCSSDNQCSSRHCSSDGTCRTAQMRVFTTSVSGPSDMDQWAQTDQSSLAGADEICNVLAAAAGINDTFVAWLSSASVDAKDRIPDSSYYLVDLVTKVVDSKADLVDGSLDNSINMHETGTTASSYVWTGTGTGGLKYPTGEYDHCSAGGIWWTNTGGVKAMIGRQYVTTSDWTQAGAMGCTGSAKLYCFEIIP
ncbi:MAG: hypothetical protein WC437_04465 [Patescibacteria group bacterium]